MKRYLALLCILPIFYLGQAQYIITPIQPPPNFTFNDLWHLSVVRSAADDNSEFYITLRVFDATNALKVKSNTRVLALPLGSYYYNLSNVSLLEPFTTSFYDTYVLQQAVSSGGAFPAGTYNLVYTLYGRALDGEFAPLTESTSQGLVEAMWPPMLLSPPDGDSIDTQYPLLTWTPAFSSGYNGQINYTLKLVELLPGQNPNQAIFSNPLFFTQNNIPATLLTYPPSAQLLDTTKVYAWQVHADAQGVYLGSSEIWTFTFKNPTPPREINKSQPFFLLSRTQKSEYVVVNDGVLRLSHVEKLNDVDEKLNFVIVDQQGKKVADQTNLDKVSTVGYNKIKISLCSQSTGFNLPKGYYSIRIRSQSGIKYYLNFFHNKTQSGCSE